MAAKKKILIIEDDPDTTRLLKDTLEDRSFVCEIAETAQEGLKKAKSTKPNLILLDLMLPGMSGFGFMREIKHLSDIRKTPVVILSSLADEDIAQETYDLGAVTYLTKACNANELISVVQEYAS